MSYLALYRKLRPKTFGEIIGQEHIVRTLTNQIESGRITHAYLFCGTRGTGKTSMAKIFARAVNCIGVAPKPCNECELCRAINDGRGMNVIEIDAASNNGVDNIREIREEVKYPPTEGYYKVYIIDEVHMLSAGAFNALLKTLEEPPEHVVFILATTDPQKLPVTVLSRCQRFDFHRIANKDMVDVLRSYMDEEGVKIEDKALEYIAGISDGAMRDALSILDQCISFYYQKEIMLDMVLDIVGSVDTEIFFRMVDSIFDNNSMQTMNIINELVIKGRDINQFVSEFIMHLRNVLIAGITNESSNALDLSSENIAKLKEQYKSLDREYIMELIQEFSLLQNQMKYTNNQRILLEVCCIKACNPVISNSESAIDVRLKVLEKKISQGIDISNVASEVKKTVQEVIVKSVPKAIPSDIKNVIDKWKEFTKNIQSPLARNMLLLNTSPAYLEDETLSIVTDTVAHKGILETHLPEIITVLKENFGKDFVVRIINRDDYNKRHRELYGQVDNTIRTKTVEEAFESINFDVDIE